MSTPIYARNPKTCLFLQETGEVLKLPYQKHLYGPYADNLNHVLKNIEGHYICGYGDGTGRSGIYVLSEGREAVEALLEAEPEAQERLERVSKLIYGFETPYGMELLADNPLGCYQIPQPSKR